MSKNYHFKILLIKILKLILLKNPTLYQFFIKTFSLYEFYEVTEFYDKHSNKLKMQQKKYD